MTAAEILLPLGRSSAEAGVLVGLILGVQRLFRRQLAPRWRCALWLLVAARLLLPFSFGSATSIFNFLPGWGRAAVVVQAAIPATAQTAAEAPQLREERPSAPTPEVAPEQTVAGSPRLQEEVGPLQTAREAFPPGVPATPPASVNWPRLWVEVWLGVAAVLGIGLAVSMLALARRIRHTPRLADSRIEAATQSARREMGLGDIYAYALKQAWLRGCPDFAFYWPVAKRDAAIAAIKAILQQPGNLVL